MRMFLPLVLRPLRSAIEIRRWFGVFVFLSAITLALLPAARAQQETETSPIVQSLEITAAVNPSCAFWLDRNWMSLGVYDGEAMTAENTVNMRCSVLPSGLQDGNFAPVCVGPGLHYQPGEDPNNPRNPRTMLKDGGDPNNPNHRLNYTIYDDYADIDVTLAGSVPWGTGVNEVTTQYPGVPVSQGTRCVGVSPDGKTHPGETTGFRIDPGGADDEMPNQTYSRPMVIYVYESADQPGTPEQGNYADTVTVYFVFKDP